MDLQMTLSSRATHQQPIKNVLADPQSSPWGPSKGSRLVQMTKVSIFY